MNKFLTKTAQMVTLTENGSKAYASTGSNLVDQFGLAGNYRGRTYQDVSLSQSLIWDENPTSALRFAFYLRMVTRKTKINPDFVTDKVQNGQGQRDESFKRLLWVAQNHPDVFNASIWLLPIVGSWKDIWTMMYIDSNLGINCINHEVMFTLLAQGMQSPSHVELVKKFMPRIKSCSKCHTEWTITTNKLAKEFANFMKWSYADYNKFKASGTAHEFQKLICSKQYDKINWNLIPGRALTALASGNFLTNHQLTDSYEKWIAAQPVAKFTGYVYELGQKVIHSSNLKQHERMTFDKQFDGLIETAKDGGRGILGNVWTALDTSGSMQTPTHAGVSAFDICVSLGIFFSTLNSGAFHKNVIMFDNISRVKQLTGNFCDMVYDITNSTTAWGSTNFNSVIEEIIRIRRTNPNIPLEDYPTTILVVSDMQFNGNGRETNYEYAKRRLSEVFPEDFVNNMKFIWWNCTSRTVTFPTTIDDGGTYMFSGFDGSVITMLLGGEFKPSAEKPQISMEDMVEAALSQEILLQVEA